MQNSAMPELTFLLTSSTPLSKEVVSKPTGLRPLKDCISQCALGILVACCLLSVFGLTSIAVDASIGAHPLSGEAQRDIAIFGLLGTVFALIHTIRLALKEDTPGLIYLGLISAVIGASLVSIVV